MAQVVHSLPSKCRDLSLNFSTSKERYNKWEYLSSSIVWIIACILWVGNYYR
jgi:hypothetical protein